VVLQEFVDEAVATANTLEEKALGTAVKKASIAHKDDFDPQRCALTQVSLYLKGLYLKPFVLL
jgi:hypothetical protein